MEKKLQNFFDFLDSGHPVVYLIIFTISFLILLWLLAPPYFADPDSFYHTKIATLMAESGLVQDFPWLEFTTLKDLYIDHHLLYHIFLVPFVILLPPLIGAKVAGILLGAIFFLAFFWLLQKLRVRGVFWWTLFLLTVNPFVFRVGLIKTTPAVLILTLVFLYFLFAWHNPPKPPLRKGGVIGGIFILSFAYVWLHGSWPLALALTGVFWIVSGFNNRTITDSRSLKEWASNWLHKLRSVPHAWDPLAVKQWRAGISRLRSAALWMTKWKNLKLPLAALLGTLSGLILNPYFPKNFEFYWLQTFKIGLVNYQSLIDVGGEWYGFGLANLIGSAPIASSLFVLGVMAFAWHFRQQPKETWAFLFMSAIFFIFTLKARRNVEFLMPYAVLFTATSIEIARRHGSLRKVSRMLKNWWHHKFRLTVALGVFFVVSVPFLLVRDIGWLKQGLHGSYAYTKYQAASEWLSDHSSEGDIVLHSDWDDSMVLFYQNHKNHYIVGLDPTFMYEYDEERYWQWVNITLGREQQNLYDIIKNQFNARYVLIEKDHERMQRNISLENNFSLVYEDSEVWIYE